MKLRFPFPLILFFFVLGDGFGAELKEARVTAVIKDVKLLPGQAEPKPAVVNDKVAGDTAVRTGVDSRSELTFADLTIARLGANTIFSFDKGSRTIDLGGGAILLRVPKDSGGARINTAAVTAAITGTTMMAEYHEGSSFKFVMLEGNSRVCQPIIDPVTHLKTDNPPECVDLGPGQMLMGKPGARLGAPVEVDLKQLVATSLLTNGFGPLGSEDLIQQEILAQLDAKANGTVVDTRWTHFDDPTSQDVVDQKTAAETATPTPTPVPTPTPTPTPVPTPTPTPTPVPTPTPTPTPVPTPTPTPTPVPTPTPTPTPVPTPTPTPTPVPTPTPTPTPVPTPTPTPQPTPSKFGTPPVITSSNLTTIDSGTIIQTDPSIMRNGDTDYGKIYRSQAQDGPLADYLFGSTRPFDTTLGLGHDTSDAPYAVFKFSNLRLAGNPTISLANNGVTILGLVSVGNITSGSPGGTLTFAGIDKLFIGTQNGAINLGSEIAFAGLSTLEFYARGTGSTLTLSTLISNVSKLKLDAEGSIQVNAAESLTIFRAFAGTDFLAGSGNITAQDIGITAENNINFNSDQFSPGSFTNTSLSLNAGVTLNITLQNNLSVFTAAASILAQGGNLNLFASATIILDLSNSTSADFVATNGDLIGANVDFIGGFVSLHAPSGNIQIRSLSSTFVNDLPVLGGSVTAGGSITTTGNLESGLIQSTSSKVDAGGLLLGTDISAGTDVNGVNGITAYGGSITANGNITSSAGSIQLAQRPNGTFGNITAGGNISAAAGIFTPGDPVVVSAGGDITTPGLITGTLKAGGNIFIDNASGSLSGIGVIANSIYASGGQGLFYAGTLNLDNVPSIKPNNGSSVNHDGGTLTDFTLQAGRIVSTGAARAILSSNGGNANPSFDDSNPGNGGIIFLGINVTGLSIGNGRDLDSVVANGGAFNAAGPFNGGNGGQILMGVNGDVVVTPPANGGPALFASSGIVSDVTSQYAGNGGRVDIAANGLFNIMGTVQVSSEDARFQGTGAGRESASGGSIRLHTGLTTGLGITIASDGNLLSLLSGNAPGPAGSITLSTMGADIVVNGLVRADFGTITLDQNDPVGATPLITLDGATLQGATLNIKGSGDLLIGPNNSTAINIFGGTWNVAHDITINAAKTSFAYSFTLNATAGNAINFTGGTSSAPATLTLPLSGNTAFNAGAGGINAQFTDISYAGAELNLMSAGDITANSIKFSDGVARGHVNATGTISIAHDLWEGSITAGGAINVVGGLIAGDVTAGTDVVVGQYISATSVTAGGDITADSTHVQNITSPAGVLRVASGINPLVFSTDPAIVEQGAAAPHVYSVDSIISPNGIDFSGNQFNGIAGYSSGGLLTINANSLTFDPSTGIGPVNFNGADVNGFSNGTTPTLAGDGGSLTVNASGDITVSSPIEATTGLVPQNAAPSGNGGTVNLNSTSGTIAINERIQVSSNDAAASPTPSPPPRRRSAQGGNISLTSGKSAPAGSRAVAINVSSSGQLLSLLAAAPTPRPGGKVTILATGANSDVNITGGKIQADGGTIDIRNSGSGGNITFAGGNGAAPVPATLSADVIKANALGANGSLSIGNSNISADTLIRLYAEGSNGQLIFVANTTLNSGSRIDLAASTITINPRVVVTISGNAGKANVYTDNPNYGGPGGQNQNNGTFGGNGANNPQPFASRPPFDAPAPRPGNRVNQVAEPRVR